MNSDKDIIWRIQDRWYETVEQDEHEVSRADYIEMAKRVEELYFKSVTGEFFWDLVEQAKDEYYENL